MLKKISSACLILKEIWPLLSNTVCDLFSFYWNSLLTFSYRLTKIERHIVILRSSHMLNSGRKSVNRSQEKKICTDLRTLRLWKLIGLCAEYFPCSPVSPHILEKVRAQLTKLAPYICIRFIIHLGIPTVLFEILLLQTVLTKLNSFLLLRKYWYHKSVLFVNLQRYLFAEQGTRWGIINAV